MPTDKDKRRVPILNTYIDALTMEETISEVEKIIARGVPTQHVVINANKVNLMNEDPELIAKLLSEHVIEAAQLEGAGKGTRNGDRPVPESGEGGE